MRRVWGIAVLCVSALASVGLSRADNNFSRQRATEGYVEDVYYWEDGTAQAVPQYNPRAREIIFIDDTAAVQHPDTVRAIIRDKQP